MYEFVPTWLYCKIHNKTGLKYLGKTISDPYQYTGSGVYWNNHLSKHGNDVTTVWAHLYTDQDLLTEEALFFSKVFNIVESNEWANLTEENGRTSGKMYERTPDHNAKMSQSLTGRKFTNEHKKNISISSTGCKRGPMSTESKLKKSIALTGKTVSESTKEKMKKIASMRAESHNAKIRETVKNLPKLFCKHCSAEVSPGNYKRWHNDNCKKKGNE